MPQLPQSSIHQRLPFFLRPDLQFVPTAGGGRIVSDPIGKVHHELSVEEAFLLDQLADGHQLSLAELNSRYELRFAPQRVRSEQLHGLLVGLHQAGLVGVDTAGQGDPLWNRHQDRSQAERLWAWTKLLAIKLPGFNPDGLLNLIAPLGRVLFSKIGLAVAICLWLIAVMVLIASADAFAAELPAIRDLFKPSCWLSLLVVVAVLKSFHELGHALACRRYGAEVREMGCLLLMFAPCLYCEVTDAWRLPSRLQRMIITLAGVLVELTIAAMAVLVWRFTEPGWLHAISMHVVLIASLGTLLVNLNPLVRYDGYYLLSDLMKTPNLWQRSRQAVSTALRDCFFADCQSSFKEPTWLIVYGLLSKLFLGCVIILFGWLILAAAKYTHFEVVGWDVISIIAAGIAVPFLRNAYRSWKKMQMSRTMQFRRSRLLFAMMIVGCLVYLIGFMPIPSTIRADAVVVPASYELVAVSHGGRVIKALPEGTPVKKGDPVLWLTNHEMQKQLASATALMQQSQLELRLLESQRAIQPSLSAQIPAAKSRLQTASEHVLELQKESEKLTLRANRDGVLVGAEFFQQPDAKTLDPLKQQNRGAWLEVGVLVGMIIDTCELELELSVPDHALDRIEAGQQVRVALNQRHSNLAQGTISKIATSSRDFKSDSLPGRATWFTPKEMFDQQETARKLRASIMSQSTMNLLIGGGGEARIDADPQTLFRQLWYALARQFRLPN